jgi:hypothetical protein
VERLVSRERKQRRKEIDGDDKVRRGDQAEGKKRAEEIGA